MERLSINSYMTPAPNSALDLTLARLGLGVATVCGALALSWTLMQLTAADRLVDGSYDQAIASANLPMEPAAGLPGPISLAAHSETVSQTRSIAAPIAATEHAWLTRPVMQGEPVPAEAVVAPLASPIVSSVIGTSVGARFTVAHADKIQSLEVIDVKEILLEPHQGAATSGAAGKMLLVSCKIIGEVKSPASDATDRARVVRFIVDADPTRPVRLPRAL
jgi:hypothetical protein